MERQAQNFVDNEHIIITAHSCLLFLHMQRDRRDSKIIDGGREDRKKEKRKRMRRRERETMGKINGGN